jgi:hypothetical protein
MNEQISGLEAAVKTLSKVRVDGFVNLRYDDERNPSQATIPDANTDNNGKSGIYSRRAEFKFQGKLSGNATFALGYDFSENKHKDLGIEVKEVSMIPFMDFPGATFDLRVGQFRMPFGITPQTSSSSIWFPERPMIFGARQNTNSQLNAGALVGERVMGLQGRHKGALAKVMKYDVQSGVFNNATQDQAAGQNSLQGAFTNQDNDQDHSNIGRLAIELSFLNFMLPEKSKIQTGASYIHDSTNSAYQAQLNSQISYSEVLGAELLISLANKMLEIQSEFVRRQTGINAANGAVLSNYREGWYGDMAFDWLPLFMSEIEKGDALHTIFRYEENSLFNTVNGFTNKVTKLGVGLKKSYWGGKNHTSINYFVSAPDGMFGGDGRAAADGGTGISAPETQIVIQQQFAFGN